MGSTVTTDEIYDRYLRKAITEINRLSHEIAQAADGAPTALPTGHPLANIFLLKYGPQAQELQEGVAFPLAGPLEDKVGELQRFTPTIEALVVPDIDSSLDEAPAKTAFWNAFKTVGPWWAALPPY